MQQELFQRLNLDGGLIVQTGAVEPDLKQMMFIIQATQYIERQIQNAPNIGLSWGADTGAIFDELNPVPQDGQHRGNVCPLMGSAPNDINWFQANELTIIFSNKTGYTPHLLSAPAFSVSSGNKHLFEQTNEYQIVSSL